MLEKGNKIMHYCSDCLREVQSTGRLLKCFQKYELWLCKGCEKVKENGQEIENARK